MKWLKEIAAGLKEGKLSMEAVNVSVKRIVQYIVKTPSFHHYYPTS